MSYYLKEADCLWPVEKSHLIHALPIGTYVVGHAQMRGWYLKEIENLDYPSKVYGKLTKQAERIMRTFNERDKTTGVLLSGEKGSGKTMLARMVSRKAAEQGLSTLVINTPFNGDGFNTFIQSINEPCVILFDEFEKVFDDKQQTAILTLLDGVYPTKKLFILTVNDKYRVNSHMRNRPGRIYYLIDFSGLHEDFIKEYCGENLKNKTHIPQICRLAGLFEAFNFDMLKALVEEMNRFDETPKQVMEMLNTKPTETGSTLHRLEVYMGEKNFREGKKLEPDQFQPATIRGTPVTMDEINVHIDLDPDDDDAPHFYVELNPEHLKKVDPENGKFTYVYEDDHEAGHMIFVISKEPYKTPMYSYLDAF